VQATGARAIAREAQMTYQAPKVTDYGSLVQLTAGQQNGNFTDRAFPDHTPKQDLTFSG
jgi:hypothetical protein